jgi:hypothetical protein
MVTRYFSALPWRQGSFFQQCHGDKVFFSIAMVTRYFSAIPWRQGSFFCIAMVTRYLTFLKQGVDSFSYFILPIIIPAW